MGRWFRTDIDALLNDDVIDQAVDHDRPLQLPPRNGINYHAFVDSSAGRSDSFAIAIGHTEGGRFIADVVKSHAPPFDPGTVAAEFAGLARLYGCTSVTGDAFAGEWTAAAFKDAGIRYERAPLSKSGILYRNAAVLEPGRGLDPRYACAAARTAPT